MYGYVVIYFLVLVRLCRDEKFEGGVKHLAFFFSHRERERGGRGGGDRVGR